MKRLVLLAVIAALVICPACASAATKKRRHKQHFGAAAWYQGVVERGLDPAEVVYPFSTTPELRQWAAAVAGKEPGDRSFSRLSRLQEAMFNREDFHFAYEEELTLTAAEAFALREGNCLAFTSLFIAAARSVGLEAYLVSVRRPPEIEKKGDLVVVNDHVVAGYDEVGRLYIYDFYLTSDVPYYQQTTIDDITASALYHNNMGGAAIRAGDLHEALRHLGLATRLDPDLAAAWINLGVARYRLDDEDGAIAAYQQALQVDPSQASALANLAYVYRKMGKDDKAREVLQEAARRRSTPFIFIALAESEMDRGNLETARQYLNRARRLDRTVPEVYLALARLASRNGDIVAAAKYRSQARKLLRENDAAS